MSNASKIAVSWVELILIVVLVVVGLSIWIFVEAWEHATMQADEPREEAYQHRAQVPLRQAQVDALQEEWKATQAELIKQRLEQAGQTAALDALTTTYPQLRAMPVLSGTTQLSATLTQTYLTALSERETTRRLIDGLSKNLNMLISSTVQISSSLATRQPATPEAMLDETRLSIAQDELAALRAQMVEQQMVDARQTATIADLLAAYPDLQKLQLPSPDLSTLPLSVLRAYVEVRIGLESSRRLDETLSANLARLEQSSMDQARALIEAQHNATRDFVADQRSYTGQRLLATLLWSCLAFGAAWLVTLAVVLVMRRTYTGQLNPWLVFGGSILLLSVLFGYQLFQAMGAALFALLVIIVILIFFPRRAGGQQSGS